MVNSGAIEATAGRLASDELGWQLHAGLGLKVIFSTKIENDPCAYAYRREQAHPFESPF